MNALRITVSSSDWGPATIAAIAAAVATIILAGFTYWLARETRNLARETNDDISAGWRPVIVPAERYLKLSVGKGEPLGHLTAAIKNGGRGPALNINAICLSASSVQTIRSGPFNLGTLSVQEPRTVHGPGMMYRDTAGNSGSWLRFYVVLIYEDLAERRYMSTLTYTDTTTDRHPGHHDHDEDEWRVNMSSMKTRSLPEDASIEELLSAVPAGLWPIEHDPKSEIGQRPKPE